VFPWRLVGAQKQKSLSLFEKDARLKENQIVAIVLMTSDDPKTRSSPNMIYPTPDASISRSTKK
jgi:hypothetical protein